MIRTRLVRAALVWSVCSAFVGAARTVVSQAGPPYAPAEALKTLRVAEGFQVEQFVTEPLIASPVAMEIDGRGRLFVVEMPGYPLDVSGSGRIKVLSDTNGDGRPDVATVFADGLRLPTGIMAWKNGVLVTDSPHVWYFEDGDGDGRAEIKREILTGFALSNPQHTTNTPIYGLDNWIYLANEGPVRTIRYRDIFGDAGGEVRFPGNPSSPRLPPDAGGRNVRFKPDTSELEMLSSRSQFGQTFDAWGHHFLVTHNRHITHEVIAARYLARNPSLVVPTAVEQVPDYPLPAALYPITQNPEFQLLTDVGVMTAASGITYYLGDLFPPEFSSAVFVAEGAHNLVHVTSLRDHGPTFRGSRMFDGREFLASTDAWFRPVNLYLGPDGALYLIDYYRKVLEHPEWMDDAAARSKDLAAGHDRGRIYRISPRGTPPPNWLGRISLADGSSSELVQALGRPNIWWRRHAQRLLIDRRPQDVAAALASMAIGNESPFARVHALWTLDGIGRLEPSVITQAMRDAIPGVRETAIALAELQLARSPSLAAPLLELTADPDPKVRFQLLLTLGGVATPEAGAARSRLLFENMDDDWMQIAALSSGDIDQSGLLDRAIERFGPQETPAAQGLFKRLGTMAGAAKDIGVARAVLQRALRHQDGPAAWWCAPTITGLGSALPPQQRRGPLLDPEREMAVDTLSRSQSAPVRRAILTLLETIGLPAGAASDSIVRDAERMVADGEAALDGRVDAIRLLALRDLPRYEPLLLKVVARPEPAPVHAAAVRALAEVPGIRISLVFLKLWERWTPSVRAEVIRTFAGDPARIRALLHAVASGRVKVSEIEWPLRVRMMMVDDEALRKRARSLLGRPASAGDSAARYRAALAKPGSAERGRQVFSKSCAVCHQYRGSGGAAFGPDLGEVRGRLPASLLTDIFRPNQSIADGFELGVADLTDGTTMTGIISAETSTSVTFRHAGGEAITVPRSTITAMRIAPMSAMPEDLASQLGVQQMADVIAFIRGGQ